ELGARVGVLDIRPEAADAIVREIVAAGGEAIALHADVLSKADLEAAAQQVLDRFGTVDALVNGAGGNRRQATTTPEMPFFDLPIQAFQEVLGLNVIGTLLPIQVFGRIMAERGHGHIINVCSIIAMRPLTNVPAYSAGKAAIKNLTEWLAVHVAQNYSPAIRVNAIAPGFFLTEQNRFLLLDERTGQSTPRGRAILEHTPLGRYGDPEELLTTVLWLLSPQSGFVHGSTAVVDGGFCAFSGV
ncbi:MAG: SDR family oxidoreductase, partial [Chloroflexi bacterium]|nr:SDR family oxidoreductase [Chloroflexota bacterium]